MRVFLVQAAAYFPETERSMPLGILYLASYLRERHGCDVRVFDMQLRVKDARPVVEEARRFSPDLVGIGGMTSDAKMALALAEAMKSAFPGAPIVVGGPHATNAPASVLECRAVDFVVRHEGEAALGALVEHVRGLRAIEEVPSLVYRRNGDLAQTPLAAPIEDLDALPFPAFDLIDLEPYYRIPRCGVIYARRRYAAIVTSRGCPYRCAYCHNILGKRYRPRSAENVVDEMAERVRRYGVGEFVVMDDMFNLQAERVNRLARLVVERGLDIRLSFPIGLRADIMTEESIRLLKEAGMYRVMYAVETASERLQTMIRKHNRLDRVAQVIDATRAQGVLVHGSFMLGFPTETEAEARSTVDWAVRSNLHSAAFYRVIPFWGTALQQMAEEAGARVPEDLTAYEFHKADDVNASRMANRTLTKLRREAYRRFYLSPRRVVALVRALPNRRRLLPQLLRMWVRKAFFW